MAPRRPIRDILGKLTRECAFVRTRSSHNVLNYYSSVVSGWLTIIRRSLRLIYSLTSLRDRTHSLSVNVEEKPMPFRIN